MAARFGNLRTLLASIARKTPDVMLAQLTTQRCKTERFRQTVGAKLKGFAPLTVIFNDKQNRKTKLTNTLQLAAEKTQKQNPLNPEV
jgi:hypothetical protein